MKRAFIPALAAAMLFSGCAKPGQSNTPAGQAEELFDYFTGGMRWNDTIEFELDEFPEVKFVWNCTDLTAVENGEKRSLYWGMPIWSIYFSDLNGDGKREIISGVSIGSGIIDDRILVYDYENSKLYSLSDRFNYNFSLLINDDKTLCYSKLPNAVYPDEAGDPVIEPLTMKILKDITGNEDDW